ncbi:TfoX/Sxy family protein [Rhodobacter sp. SY28-1]|uniref:TfoX/Sxy family protein n=1 Tax=Rhodobacter sp. SY28-1 TaxID=2562317 RepID=UPI0010C0AB5B|nr:TfoX/Sxy family protein [Rhodobacter sp. SY28-1]
MARDPGLEAVLSENLADLDNLATTTMFGGLAWMWNGHLLCGARTDGLMVRLGKGNDAWALALPGADHLRAGERVMDGWVRVPAEIAGDDALRRRLLDAATAFVRALPPKVAKPAKR